MIGLLPVLLLASVLVTGAAAVETIRARRRPGSRLRARLTLAAAQLAVGLLWGAWGVTYLVQGRSPARAGWFVLALGLLLSLQGARRTGRALRRLR